MSVKPRFDTYRYVGEICRLRGQSVVECRLPGSEISSILAVYAKAIPTETVCADGEARYSGRLLLSVVYEDGDKKVCRIERGAEFFHKAEGGLLSPSCFAKTAFTTENVNWRREGSGLYISVVVGAEIAVFGSKQMEYLSDGEGLICQKKAVTVCKTVCVSGETEAEDEFESDYVGDVLLHSESAIVHRVEVGAGTLELEGETALHICVLKSDESICSYERLIPFRMQVPCDEAFGNVRVGARVLVKNSHLTAGTDEEKGKSKMVFSYCLSADCFVTVFDEVSVVDDAFALDCETSLKKRNEGGRYATKQIKCTERVSGIAAISPNLDGEYTLQATLLPRAEIAMKKTENGMEAEGVVLAEVLLCNGDNMHRSATLSLPFVFPVDVEGEEAEAECLVCGLNVRRKTNGEIEAEAPLKLCVRSYEQRAWEYVFETEVGEEICDADSAFTVFIPRAGEGLWELAKRLHCAPDELQKSNPSLQFPIKDGEKIFVYRQIP